MIRTGPAALAGVVLLTTVSAVWGGESPSEKRPKVQYQGEMPLMIMSIDGKELRQFTFVSGYETYGSPMWSHDGTQVAFDAYSGDMSGTHVFIAKADGSSPRDLGDGAMPTWAPGDQRLAIHRYDDNWGIWAIGSDGKGLERLTSQGNSPRWCSDGLRIAHLGSTADVPRDHGIMIFNTVEGKDEMLLSYRQLPAPYRSIDLGFQWSPAGDRLALAAGRQDGGDGVFIWNPKQPQGPKLRLAASGNSLGGLLAWSPDGKQLLVALKGDGDRAQQAYRLDVDTDAPPVRLPGQDPARSVDDMAWSPDGKWIMFSSEAVQ